MSPRYWDAEYSRRDRELSAAREAHNLRPFHPETWQRHLDARASFDAYVDAIHAGYDAEQVRA